MLNIRIDCRDISPLTGKLCVNEASVTLSRDLHVCATCALRRYKLRMPELRRRAQQSGRPEHERPLA
jgi:hypothetical protein